MMNRNLLTMLLLFLMVFVVVWGRGGGGCECEYESFEKTDAAEACKKISSRADDITAQFDGAAKVVDSAWAFLSPKNYKSGDNKSQQIMKNVINTDLSNNDITKIQSDCKSSSIGSQINDIDTTECPFCADPSLCQLSNITQTNIDDSDQTCVMQSAIESLTSKKNSIDAQALAQALQKAQDIMSGDNSNNQENCNIADTNMSSNQYMEAISKCSNEIKVDQKNRIKACGGATNVIQLNKSKKLQECRNTAVVRNTVSVDNETSLLSSTKVDQTTVGLAVGGSIVVCLICLSSSASAAYLSSQ